MQALFGECFCLGLTLPNRRSDLPESESGCKTLRKGSRWSKSLKVLILTGDKISQNVCDDWGQMMTQMLTQTSILTPYATVCILCCFLRIAPNVWSIFDPLGLVFLIFWSVLVRVARFRGRTPIRNAQIYVFSMSDLNKS